MHISNTLTTSYLEQLCRHGFFHCDPHPGNLAVDNGYPGGRVVYYDFGMMERVEPAVRKGFVELIFSIYRTLPREACDALEVMGVLRPGIGRFSNPAPSPYTLSPALAPTPTLTQTLTLTLTHPNPHPP